MAWIQYWLTDGSQSATVKNRVDDAILVAQWKEQIEFPPEMGDPCQYNVDITQSPPVLKLRTSP